MILGAAAAVERCNRPERHSRHRWVTSPASRVDHDCDGLPIEPDEVLFDLAVSAA